MSLPSIMAPSAALDTMSDSIRLHNGLTAMGVYVFAGGFSLGVEKAGFKVCGHLEGDNFGVKVATQRWPVCVLPPAHWLKGVADTMLASGSVPDLIHMNPPCSAYAKNGLRGGLSDPIMKCVEMCVDFGLRMQPKAFVWELVPGIYDRDPQYLHNYAKRCAEHGYEVHAFLTNSALHGAPQARPRFHFVASKYKIDWQGTYDGEDDDHKGWKPIQWAIDKVAEAEKTRKLKNHMDSIGQTQLEKIVKYCPPGTYLSQLPDYVYIENYKKRGGRAWQPGDSPPGVSRLRAMPDKPSPVIIGGMSTAHPSVDRFMTARECATVMGFPLDFEFSSSRTMPYKEIGKGLCVENARFVALAIAQAIERGEPADPTPRFISTDWRDRASVPTLTSSKDFKAAWWAERGIKQGERTKALPKSNRPNGGRSANKTPTIQVIGTSIPDDFIERIGSYGIQVGNTGPVFGFAVGVMELMTVLFKLKKGDYLYTDCDVPPDLEINEIKTEDALIETTLNATGFDLKGLILAKVTNLTPDQLVEVAKFIDDMENDNYGDSDDDAEE
jgi:site-specific DNA-cytosine methylase